MGGEEEDVAHQDPKFAVDQIVGIQKDGEFCMCVVLGVNENGTYTLQHAEGDVDENVPEDLIEEVDNDENEEEEEVVEKEEEDVAHQDPKFAVDQIVGIQKDG